MSSIELIDFIDLVTSILVSVRKNNVMVSDSRKWFALIHIYTSYDNPSNHCVYHRLGRIIPIPNNQVFALTP